MATGLQHQHVSFNSIILFICSNCLNHVLKLFRLFNNFWIFPAFKNEAKEIWTFIYNSCWRWGRRSNLSAAQGLSTNDRHLAEQSSDCLGYLKPLSEQLSSVLAPDTIRGSRWWLKYLGPRHPCQRTRLNSWLQGLVWHSPGCWGLLQNTAANIKYIVSIYLSVWPCLSA